MTFSWPAQTTALSMLIKRLWAKMTSVAFLMVSMGWRTGCLSSGRREWWVLLFAGLGIQMPSSSNKKICSKYLCVLVSNNCVDEIETICQYVGQCHMGSTRTSILCNQTRLQRNLAMFFWLLNGKTASLGWWISHFELQILIDFACGLPTWRFVVTGVG